MIVILLPMVCTERNFKTLNLNMKIGEASFITLRGEAQWYAQMGELITNIL